MPTRYTLELDIDVPRDKLIEYFDNPDNLPKWQPSLISVEHMSGEPGQPSAKTMFKYKMGKREVDMVETILTRKLPDEFTATYEAKGVWNEMLNYFHEIDGGSRTRWEFETEFRCTTLMLRLMSFFMPNMFKKASAKNMQDFKKFAEAEYAKEQ